MDVSEVIQQAVEEDHRLENQAQSSARALMQHRWHWTLDESNPDRVSLSEYARQVGKNLSVIHRYAKGFTLLPRAGEGDPEEARRRAEMSAEKQEVVGAVAEARGVSFGYAEREFGNEIKRVREEAREISERRPGTSVGEAAREFARTMVRSERKQAETEQERKSNANFQYIRLEGELAKARGHLLEATQMSEGVRFDHEERELLAHAIDTVRRILDLLDESITDHRSTGWSEKLRVVAGGE